MNKITMFIPSLAKGGAERVFVNLANELSKTIDIELVTCSGGDFVDELSDKVNYHDLNSKSLVRGILPLFIFFIKKRPKVIFSTIKEQNIICLILNIISFNFGEIYIREANTLSQETDFEKGVKSKLRALIIKLVYPLASGIIVLSDLMKEDLKNFLLFNASKVFVIENPVDHSMIIEKSNEAIDDVLPKDKIIILTLARLYPSKGHKKLIRLVHAINKLENEKKVCLVCIGDGWYRKELEAYSSYLDVNDSVLFLGGRRNPYPYIKRSNILALASDFEGMPNTILEGVCLNKKILCSENSGAAPIIVKRSNSGVIFSDDKILDSYIELKNISKFDGYLYIKSNHDIKEIASKYKKILIGGK